MLVAADDKGINPSLSTSGKFDVRIELFVRHGSQWVTFAVVSEWVTKDFLEESIGEKNLEGY